MGGSAGVPPDDDDDGHIDMAAGDKKEKDGDDTPPTDPAADDVDLAAAPVAYDPNTAIDADLVKKLNRNQINERIAALELLGSRDSGQTAEFNQLQLWQERTAKVRAEQRLAARTADLAVLPPEASRTAAQHRQFRSNTRSQALNTAILKSIETRIPLFQKAVGDTEWAFDANLLPPEPPFDPKIPVTAQSSRLLIIPDIQKRIDVINAAGGEPAKELKQLEYIQVKIELERSQVYRQRVAKAEKDFDAKNALPLSKEQTDLKNEIERRSKDAIEKVNTAQQAVKAAEEAIRTGGGGDPWSYLSYENSLEFEFDPRVPIDGESILEQEASNIEARLKEFENIRTGGGILLPEETEEELQLKLWQAEVALKNLAATADAASKKAAEDKVAAAKSALTTAGLTPWDFGRYVPPMKAPAAAAAGAGPSGTSKHKKKKQFEDKSENPFDLKSKYILGQMFEAAGKFLTLFPSQVALEYLVARPLAVVRSELVSLTYTFGAGVAKFAALPFRMFGINLPIVNTINNWGNDSLKTAETNSGTWAIMYRGAVYLVIKPVAIVAAAVGAEGFSRACNETINSLHVDSYALAKHAKNHGAINAIRCVTPAIVPNAFIFISNLIPAAGHLVASGLWNFRSILNTDPAMRTKYADYAHSHNVKFGNNLYASGKVALRVITNPISQGIFLVGLTEGGEHAKNKNYDALCKYTSPNDPDKSMFATNHNFVRWLQETNLQTAGANNTPTLGSLMGYFIQRSKNITAIRNDLKKILSAFPAGADRDAVKQMISDLKKMKNNPSISAWKTFAASLKLKPGETESARLVRIQDEFSKLAAEDYFTDRKNELAKVDEELEKQISEPTIAAPVRKELKNIQDQLLGTQKNPSLSKMEDFNQFLQSPAFAAMSDDQKIAALKTKSADLLTDPTTLSAMLNGTDVGSLLVTAPLWIPMGIIYGAVNLVSLAYNGMFGRKTPASATGSEPDAGPNDQSKRDGTPTLTAPLRGRELTGENVADNPIGQIKITDANRAPGNIIGQSYIDRFANIIDSLKNMMFSREEISARPGGRRPFGFGLLSAFKNIFRGRSAALGAVAPSEPATPPSEPATPPVVANKLDDARIAAIVNEAQSLEFTTNDENMSPADPLNSTNPEFKERLREYLTNPESIGSNNSGFKVTLNNGSELTWDREKGFKESPKPESGMINITPV